MLFLFKCWAFVLLMLKFPCFFPMANIVPIRVLLRIWLICSQQPGAGLWNWKSGMLHLVKDNSALVHSPGRKIRPVQVLSKFLPGYICVVQRALSPFGLGSRSHTAMLILQWLLDNISCFPGWCFIWAPCYTSTKIRLPDRSSSEFGVNALACSHHCKESCVNNAWGIT